jgi:RHS repeat-associated protein
VNVPQYTWSVNETYEYDPWGQIIFSSTVNPPYTKYQYEGKERENGLDNFGARSFDSETISAGSAMRWISTDPVTSNVYDPQSLNKYTYVRNDPVNLIDPDGQLWTKVRDADGNLRESIPIYGVEEYYETLPEVSKPVKLYAFVIVGYRDVSRDPRKESPYCDRSNPNNAKKLDWIKAHREDAERVAKELHTTTANILGLSALESGWGQGPFVINGGNNFFGMHYSAKNPPALSTGPIPGHKVQMAQYASYADSAESFALSKGGKLVTNITDASSFAKKLQDAGLYGIDPDTGNKVKSYVGDVAVTISGLAIRLNCEQ